MIKGKWLTRALHVTIALSFILGAFVVAPSVSADPGTSQWEKQTTPTDDDKVERLAEQVVWADRNQLLHRVQEFFDRMPTSCWVRIDK